MESLKTKLEILSTTKIKEDPSLFDHLSYPIKGDPE